MKLLGVCIEAWVYVSQKYKRKCERESQREGVRKRGKEGERKSTFHPYVQMSDKVCGRLCLLLPFSLILSQLIIRLDLFDPTGSLIHSLCMCAIV